jgi:hypothetical protein
VVESPRGLINIDPTIQATLLNLRHPTEGCYSRKLPEGHRTTDLDRRKIRLEQSPQIIRLSEQQPLRMREKVTLHTQSGDDPSGVTSQSIRRGIASHGDGATTCSRVQSGEESPGRTQLLVPPPMEHIVLKCTS